MSVDLRMRLDRSIGLLADVETRLSGGGRALPAAVEERLLGYARSRTQLEDVRGLIALRLESWGLLDAIDGSSDRLRIGTHEMSLHSARTILMQGHIALTWSIADNLTWVAGRLVCNEGVTKNPRHGPKLFEHFARDAKSSPSSGIVHDLYAFPVALCYAIRNHLVHDGGRSDGRVFFDVASGTGPFAVSPDAWDALEKFVNDENKVDRSRCRAPEQWPWARDDLRKVLRICEREIDDALGILLVSACAGLHAQVELLR